MSEKEDISSFNIEGNPLQQEKSGINISHLDVFEALGIPYQENPDLLSVLEIEKDLYVEDNKDSFLITDEHFKNPIINDSFTLTDNIFTFYTKAEPEKEEPIFELDSSTNEFEMMDIDTIINFNMVSVDKEHETFILERRDELVPDTALEAFFPKIKTPEEVETPLVSETQKEEREELIAEKHLQEAEEKQQKVEEEERKNTEQKEDTEPENISKDTKHHNIISINGIILHKKRNLSVKILVNEEELAKYFETTDIPTDKENMSPETTSIIDQFLQNEPKLSRSRMNLKLENSPIPNLLTEDEEEIVTETMAYLYYSQGNKTEAIRIYEKLCLQFPEKSAYFATQINKIIDEL